MSLIKYATTQVDGIWVPNKKVATRKNAADHLDIEEIPEDFVFDANHVYSTVRALSSRVNLNNDGFRKMELLGAVNDLPPHNDHYGYRTFIGKNNHIDHFNQPHLATMDKRHEPRGKILWSWYHEDPMDEPVKIGALEDPVSKLAENDSWVRLLIANDRTKFPLLAECIENGIINKVSMGCEIIHSSCSVCGNKARNEVEFCDHAQLGRGQVFAAKETSPFVEAGIITAGEPIVAFEDNHGLQFFEESWILDVQADPTAVSLDRIQGENGRSLRDLLLAGGATEKDREKVSSFYLDMKKKAVEDEEPEEDNLEDAKGPGVNVHVDNQPEESDGRFDHDRTPDEQEGEFKPTQPFPCSAIMSARHANPEQKDDLDPTINSSKCGGCMYNRSNKVGYVDCNFPEVVRPGGSDPLPPGFEDPLQSDPSFNSSGFMTEDGTPIEEFPGINHPPTTTSKDVPYSPFVKGGAWIDDSRGSWKESAEQEDLFKGYYDDLEEPSPKSQSPLFNYEDGGNVERFSEPVKLPHWVGLIFVEAFDINNNPVNKKTYKEWHNLVEYEMMETFGGAFWTPASGPFSVNNVKYQDEGEMVVSYVSESDFEYAEKFMRDLALETRKVLNQHSVLYVIDGEATII